jgi:hypothetical protein
MVSVFENVNIIVAQWAFWTGLVSVVLFAGSRFKVTLPDSDELSPPLLPRSFTTGFRFWLATCTYAVGYLTLYFGLLIVASFPQLRSALSGVLPELSAEVGKPAIGTPAWAALVATAVLPALPWVSGIDQWVRASLQDFASIPSKARMLAADMLNALAIPEPAPIDDDSSPDEICAAIKSHHERFEQMEKLWQKLQRVSAPGIWRKYRDFQKDNQKLLSAIELDFSATAGGKTPGEAARYIEGKHREGVTKAARFIVCAMLNSESTELTVRQRLRELGLQVQLSGLNFRLTHIILSLFVIAFTTVAGCYLSALFYYCVEVAFRNNSELSLLDLLREGTPVFFGWTFSTVLIYVLPITLAAGAAMYVLDRAAANIPMAAADYMTAAVLTFLGSAMLALFILLAYADATHMFDDNKTQWITLVPWVIPPSLVAATFMWLSTNPKNLLLDHSETGRYIVAHSAVAVVGSLVAYFLWRLTGGTPQPAQMNNLPADLFIYFVIIAAACIGGSIGWVLSGTNQPFRIGNLIRKREPAAAAPAVV